MLVQFAVQRERARIGLEVSDEIVRKYRFCNVLREHDRGSWELERVYALQLVERQVAARWIGRVVNKPVTVAAILGMKTFSLRKCEKILTQYGMNTCAYRLNTSCGLNSFEGVARQVQLSLYLPNLPEECSDKQAWEILWGCSRDEQVAKFVVFQIVLDLLAARLVHHDTTWTLIGNGALQALAWIAGTSKIERWNHTVRKQRCCSHPLEISKIAQILSYLGGSKELRRYLPRELTLHDAENVLCEFAKWLRVQTLERCALRRYRPFVRINT